ncbi:hypothetical protein HNY73_023188 [Argiope bruennichi]|uniref:Uncharacterized protein n=1 Tax=Argiope bruennichi TaxID=94029 RepID=A0A8T0E702_ARGBR|nr:hypothetical protein HNY73_023188 [Argiope bruennichi]
MEGPAAILQTVFPNRPMGERPHAADFGGCLHHSVLADDRRSRWPKEYRWPKTGASGQILPLTDSLLVAISMDDKEWITKLFEQVPSGVDKVSFGLPVNHSHLED